MREHELIKEFYPPGIVRTLDEKSVTLKTYLEGKIHRLRDQNLINPGAVDLVRKEFDLVDPEATAAIEPLELDQHADMKMADKLNQLISAFNAFVIRQKEDGVIANRSDF